MAKVGTNRKRTRAYDARQAEYEGTISYLEKYHKGKTPSGGWRTAFKRPGSWSQKHVRG